ncbi:MULTISPECIES: hypothetical protein [Pseudomonas]|uniref:Uncharacterized protein n=1 Tax=Pseudomonas wuhanensis TaxID=2954098 RepID=A0ABY9GLN3_9PSED|nr:MULTISPECIES: hypothetical protein [unclassified Pseudomonas]WLI10697.1 hypothetical protein PSH65_20990 [Pseudomonas sp. FP603]WLI16513.1 hypothetical protein PSH88_19615 [Pseudomonas sp. FP607]
MATSRGGHGKTCETLEQRLRPEGLELQEVEKKPENDFQSESDQADYVSS